MAPVSWCSPYQHSLAVGSRAEEERETLPFLQPHHPHSSEGKGGHHCDKGKLRHGPVKRAAQTGWD